MTAPVALPARDGTEVRAGRFVLEVDDLKKYFSMRRGLLNRTRADVRAVNNA